MVLTRREALGGAAALVAAVAGCSKPSSDSTADDAPRDRARRPENVALDPPTVKLRRAGNREPIVEVPDGGDDSNQTERARRRAVRRGFVTSSEAASLLRIDDVEGAESARTFLAETDFAESFVFVDRTGVDQCFRQVLCYVTWSTAELRRTYAEVYREYDVACRTDARDRVARFIRLEGDVNGRQIESGGTHVRRGGCPIPQWRRDEDTASPTETGRGTETGTPTESARADHATRSVQPLGGRNDA